MSGLQQMYNWQDTSIAVTLKHVYKKPEFFSYFPQILETELICENWGPSLIFYYQAHQHFSLWWTHVDRLGRMNVFKDILNITYFPQGKESKY